MDDIWVLEGGPSVLADGLCVVNLVMQGFELCLNSKEASTKSYDGSCLIVVSGCGTSCRMVVLMGLNSSLERKIRVAKLVELLDGLLTVGDVRAFGLGFFHIRRLGQAEDGNRLIYGRIVRELVNPFEVKDRCGHVAA